MLRFLLCFLCVWLGYITHNFAFDNHGDSLDANQHVIMFEKGVDAFTASDYNKALHYWLPLARSGDMMAARNMALLYHKGLGIEKDLEEAEVFYRLAADNGVTEAQTILGVLLIKGNEFKRNIPEAIKYLTAASKAGDPIAAWNLGLIYEHGVEVNKNREQALSLFQKAARSGYEPAIAKMSGVATDTYNAAPPLEALKTSQDKNMLSDDSVIPKNKTFAQKVAADKQHDADHFSDRIHFNRDAQSDDPDVALKTDLGEYNKIDTGIDQDLDPFGVGTSKKNRLGENFNTDSLAGKEQLKQANQAYTSGDYAKAKKIWEALAQDEAYFDEASLMLGQLYASGSGVSQDLFKAYSYWKQAADAGGTKSHAKLEEFRSSLNDAKLLEYEQKTMSIQ